MDVSDTYTYCKEHEITSGMLHLKDLPTLPCLKNGLVLELSSLKKHGLGSWDDFKDWLQSLSGNNNPVSGSAVQKSVSSLESKNVRLHKNKHRCGESEIRSFLDQTYQMPVTKMSVTQQPVTREPPCQSKFMKEATTTVNHSLAVENAELRAKIAVGTNMLLAKNKKIATLTKKIKELNPHNIRRQINRKNSKIAEYKGTIAQLKKEVKSSTCRQIKLKRLQDQVRYYIAKCQSLTQLEDSTDTTLEDKIEQLKQKNLNLLNVNAEYRDSIKKLESSSKKLIFYKDGKYTDSLRMCIMELLSYNVGILNVAPIIHSVLHLAGLEYDRLPKHTTINELIIESRSLAQAQVAETLLQAPNATLHSDGTSKFRHKYMSYQVTTVEETLSIGLQASVRFFSIVLI